MRTHDDAGVAAREPPAALARAGEESAADAFSEDAAGLPWLFPWILAMTGILITLALMR